MADKSDTANTPRLIEVRDLDTNRITGVNFANVTRITKEFRDRDGKQIESNERSLWVGSRIHLSDGSSFVTAMRRKDLVAMANGEPLPPPDPADKPKAGTSDAG